MALGRVRWLCGCRSHPMDVGVGVGGDVSKNEAVSKETEVNNNEDDKTQTLSKSGDNSTSSSSTASKSDSSDSSDPAAVVGNSDTLKSSTTTIYSGHSSCSGSESALPALDLGPSENKHVTPKDFEFLRVIGKGSFGKVLLAKHRGENTYYAVKVLSKKIVLRRNEARHIMSERQVLLQNVSSPFLVSLHYSFQTADKLYFVLDYINGGELFFHLQRERRFPESRARLYAAEAGAALAHLHALGVVYRDLKPENLLLDSQGHLVLTDFGLSKQLSAHDAQTHTFCGTPEYLAPEILKNQGYDSAVDWWCLGAVLHEMLFGLPPFYTRDPAEMHNRILKSPLKLKPGASPEAEDILHKLLRKDRAQRLGAPPGGFKDVQAHAFFKPVDWELLMRRGIKPEFDPSVSDPLDLHNIDPEFTDEPVANSVAQSQSQSQTAHAHDDLAFAGFSYAPPAALQ